MVAQDAAHLFAPHADQRSQHAQRLAAVAGELTVERARGLQAAQAAQVRAAQPTHHQGLERVVRVVPGQHVRDVRVAGLLGQHAVARLARAGFERRTVLGQLDLAPYQRNPERQAEPGAEGGVGAAVRAAQPVVDVDGEHARALLGGRDQMEQEDAVRAARKGHQYRRLGGQAHGAREPIPAGGVGRGQLVRCGHGAAGRAGPVRAFAADGVVVAMDLTEAVGGRSGERAVRSRRPPEPIALGMGSTGASQGHAGRRRRLP